MYKPVATALILVLAFLFLYNFKVERQEGLILVGGKFWSPKGSGKALNALVCGPASQSVSVNQVAKFSASGGSPSYTWNANDGDPSSGTGSDFSTKYSKEGSETVRLRDSVLGYAECNVTITAAVPPAPDDPSNISATQPNYCISGPAVTISWSYSDPSGAPQGAYQVQVDDQGSFGSPEVDSEKVICVNCRSYFSGQGYLVFNANYKARVRVWNSYDIASGWTESGSWKTPAHAYPNVNSPYQFSWSPRNPLTDALVKFTDRTLFDPQSSDKQWLWTFIPSGGGPGSSMTQNPSYSFNQPGFYRVTESARDNALPAGQYCVGSTQTINVQKPVPIWKEVLPR